MCSISKPFAMSTTPAAGLHGERRHCALLFPTRHRGSHCDLAVSSWETDFTHFFAVRRVKPAAGAPIRIAINLATQLLSAFIRKAYPQNALNFLTEISFASKNPRCPVFFNASNRQSSGNSA